MTTTVKVKITVVVDLSESWDDDCSMAQIVKQASDRAQDIILSHNRRMFTIIGKPVVEAVTSTRTAE